MNSKIKNRHKIFTIFQMFIIMSFLVIFSGCDGNSGGFDASSLFGDGSTAKFDGKVDQTGKGLEISIRQDLERISEKKVKCKITIKNSGQKPIELEKTKFKVSTLQTINDKSVIDEKDLEKIINTIFKGEDSLKIINGYNRDYEVIFEVNDEYFKNINHKDFTYYLETSYDYKTEFSNNLEIDTSQFKDSNKLKVLNRVSQAAPVIINKIDIKQQNQEGAYIISYYITRQDGYKTKILLDKTKFDIMFSNKPLSNCRFYKLNKENTYTKVDTNQIALVDDLKTVRYSCLLTAEQMTPYKTKSTTQTSGEFTYEHKIKLENKITLPEARDFKEIDW